MSPDGRFVAFLTKRFADLEDAGQLSGCWFDPLDEPLCPESYVAVWQLPDTLLTACHSDVPSSAVCVKSNSCDPNSSQDDGQHSIEEHTVCAHGVSRNPHQDALDAASVPTCAICRLPPSEDDVGHLRVACARDGCTVCLTVDVSQTFVKASVTHSLYLPMLVKNMRNRLRIVGSCTLI